MKLDKEIFSKSKIDFKSLVPYGFEEMKDGTFSFSKQILDGEFILKVDITKQGTITCRVIEVALHGIDDCQFDDQQYKNDHAQIIGNPAAGNAFFRHSEKILYRCASAFSSHLYP